MVFDLLDRINFLTLEQLNVLMRIRLHLLILDSILAFAFYHIQSIIEVKLDTYFCLV